SVGNLVDLLRRSRAARDNLRDYALPRDADQNRITERDDPRQLCEHGERMLASLGESDAGIDDDPFWVDSGSLGHGNAKHQLVTDLAHRVVAVVRELVTCHFGHRP